MGARRWGFGSLLAAGTLSAAGGCLSPNTTEFPSLFPTRPKYAEKRSYERHDPFPDASIAPQTFVRPRGYEVPRTPERQNAEDSYLRGLQSVPGQTSPLPPSATRDYPQSVPH